MKSDKLNKVLTYFLLYHITTTRKYLSIEIWKCYMYIQKGKYEEDKEKPKTYV